LVVLVAWKLTLMLLPDGLKSVILIWSPDTVVVPDAADAGDELDDVFVDELEQAAAANTMATTATRRHALIGC
jgi:hypothetical protein